MRLWLFCALLGGCHWFFGISEHEIDASAGDGPWRGVGVGARHVCALDRDHHILCWGDDHHGQLGLAASTTTPTPVGDPAVVWTAVAAGESHSCGIHDGAVSCWGANAGGQISGPPGMDVHFPTQVALPVGTSSVTSVVAGTHHTCALAGDQVWCWGQQTQTTMDSPIPVQIAGSWRAIAAGFDHTCAIATTGGVTCWGANGFNQCGPATTELPQLVDALPGPAIQVGAGMFTTCAIVGQDTDATTGQVWCWGNNGSKEIDSGSANNRPPIQILDGDDWTSVEVGHGFACALRQGVRTCWGTAVHGGLGVGLWAQSLPPRAATAGPPAGLVAFARGPDGEELGCSLTSGNLACWGDNRSGQLVELGTTLHDTPMFVPPPAGRAWEDHVRVGSSHACARADDQTLWCWGADDVGQVTAQAGKGSLAPCTDASCDQPLPVQVTLAAAVEDTLAGHDFTCVLEPSAAECWGSNVRGALGVNDPDVHHNTLTFAKAITLHGGPEAACAVLGTSDVQCWGLINNTTQFAPTQLADGNLQDVVELRFGGESLAFHFGGGGRGYGGYNFYGEFGDGSHTSGQPQPIPPTRSNDGLIVAVMDIAGTHVCAATTAKTIACWGSDAFGVSGADPGTHTGGIIDMPALVKNAAGSPLGGCTHVSTAETYTCGICNAMPTCWGLGAAGRRGRGDDGVGASWIPGPVAVPAKTWLEVELGDEAACAIAMDHTLACWGLGVRGQLGDGSHGSSVPVPIAHP